MTPIAVATITIHTCMTISNRRRSTMSASAPAGKAANANANPESKMNLKKVHMEGNVEVFSGTMHVKSETMDYDPQKHIMIARGAGRKRVQKFNERGQEEASFDEFVYDTVKGIVISSKNGIFTQDK